MLGSLTSFFSKYRKGFVFLMFLTVLFFLDFDISFAADEADPSASEKWVIAVNAIYKIVAWIMWILTAFVSLFLQPEWVNGTFIDLDLYMREIWIFVSNIVYFIFAFLLIFIAFANIIWVGKDKFGLKQALPKFFVGILIVPFSWFIVQFMISLAGVLTVWALTLPYEMFKDRAAEFPVYSFGEEDASDSESLAEATICTDYVIHFGDTPPEIRAWNVTEQEFEAGAQIQRNDPIYCRQSEAEKPKILDILAGKQIGGKESVYSIISLYTFGLIGMEKMDNLEWATFTEWFVTTMVSLFAKLGLGLVFLIVYFVLLIALFFALFIRILRIWIYIMLSPFFWLVYFFGKSSDWALAKFNFMTFFKLTMVPVYVSLALSFWFMFMLVASNGLQNQAQTNDTDKIAPLQVWIIQIEITGNIFETGDALANEEANNLMAKMFSFKGLGWALWETIVLLFWIWVLWVAVMAALRSSEITEAVVKPIYDFGTQVWQLAAKAPMYAPIIPTWSGGMSAATAMSVGKQGISYAEWMPNQNASEFIWNKWWFGKQSESLREVGRYSATSNEDRATAYDAYKNIITWIQDSGDITRLSNQSDFIDRFKMMMEDLELDTSNVKTGMWSFELAKAIGDVEAALDANSSAKAGQYARTGVLTANNRNKNAITNEQQLLNEIQATRRATENESNNSGGASDFNIQFSSIQRNDDGTITENAKAKEVAQKFANNSILSDDALLREVKKWFDISDEDESKAQKIVEQLLKAKNDNNGFIILEARDSASE